MNVICLLGRLTADPELRHTANQVSVTSFTIAVDRRFVAQGQERQADFINIVAWRQTADFCNKFLHKGDRVAVEGTIQNRSYDAQDGSKRYVTEIMADSVEALTDRPKQESKPGPQDFVEVEDDKDLPF